MLSIVISDDELYDFVWTMKKDEMQFHMEICYMGRFIAPVVAKKVSSGHVGNGLGLGRQLVFVWDDS